MWVGNHIRASTVDEEGAHRGFVFLLGMFALLLSVLVIVQSMDNQISSFLFAFLLPAICGMEAYLFLQLFSDRIGWSRDKFKISLLILIVVFLFILLAITSVLLTPVSVILGGVLLALVWKVWYWIGRWFLTVWVVQMFLLCVSIWATDTNTPLISTPPFLAFFVQLV